MMSGREPQPRPERFELRKESDVVRARRAVRTWAKRCGFGLVAETKLITAVSEITRNAIDHGQGGWITIDEERTRGKRGLVVICEDEGPGIDSISTALEDGFSTGQGLGLGLSGSKRLVDDLEIESRVGQGTKVVLRKWV